MIYTLGESLMDIIVESNDKVIVCAGGAMLNVAVSLARAKAGIALISELGDDKTAGFILDFLKTNGVNIRYIKKYYHCNTSLALAHLDENKKPAYTFYKSYPEKRRLLPPANFKKGDILLFGSLYSLDASLRNELKAVLIAAKTGGAFICFDPNIRHSHHFENEETKSALMENLALADLIKGSDEDFENIFGKISFREIFDKVRKINSAAPLVITRGAAGVVAFSKDFKLEFPAIPVKLLSTIGAGDAFNAGIAFAMHKSNLQAVQKNGFSKSLMELLLKSGLSFSAEVCGSVDNYIDPA
ncbi:MAG: carbohydrate kinase [Bacteroidales bacterium]|nr:carbohydrate kinase [Bacteroidales bacterium]